MAGNADNLLLKVGDPGSATNLDANYTAGDSTVTVVSTSNWTSTGEGVIFAMDTVSTVDGEEVQDPGSYNEFEGTVSSATSVTNVDWVRGPGDTNYSAGAATRVYIPVSAERENRIVDWGAVSHTLNGDIDATNTASFQEHIDMADTKAIRDGNDNELIKMSQTPSAVNEFTVANAATGNGPKLSATGDDTNIDLEGEAKGTGRAFGFSSVATGTISANASGSVAGLGFTPQSVEFYRFSDSATNVFNYGISMEHNATITHHGTGTTSSGSAKSSSYSIVNATGNGTFNITGSVTSFDSDGFTFTMNQTAAVDYLYIARG